MLSEREQVLRPVPGLVGNHEEYEVETILNKRKLRSRDTEYLVKWRGYHVKEWTWVPSSDLGNAKKAVQDFEEKAKLEKQQKGWSGHQFHLEEEGLANETWAKLGSLDVYQNVVLNNNGNKAYHFFVLSCSVGWWDLVLILQYACR